MNIPFVNLKKQYQSIRSEISVAIQRVLDSQHFILGDETISFEEEFAHYVGRKFAVGVDNGTGGLQLALRALGVGPGDEVITQVNIHVATVVAIKEVGATAILVDIDPETHQIDIEQVKKKISKKTKALMPVHLYGAPCQIDKFLDLSKQHNLFLIEDACQAHGTEFKGKKVGTFGKVGVFSFYPGKNLGAYGNGGAIVTDDPKIDKRLRQLRNFGQQEKYFHPESGINSRLDELQAAILKVKLKYLEKWNASRNVLALRYKEKLEGVQIPGIIRNGKSNYHLFVVEVGKRDALLSFLVKKGIMAQIHYPIPVHLQPGYRYLGYKRGDFPIAESLARRILSLPIYPEMTPKEVDYICSKVKKFYATFLKTKK